MKPSTKEIEILQGFYPSLVYLPVSQQVKHEQYVQEIASILKQMNVGFQAVEDLHVSLTKTFHPVYEEIGQIVAKCRKAVERKQIRLPVILLFRRVQILENFITLEVEKITAERLLPITQFLSQSLNVAYYSEPIFHVSLFKILTQIDEITTNRLLSTSIGPKKSYSLSSCLMKAGKTTYKLN